MLQHLTRTPTLWPRTDASLLQTSESSTVERRIQSRPAYLSAQSMHSLNVSKLFPGFIIKQNTLSPVH